VVMDNMENGDVKFVSASPDLTSKLKNYGSVTHNEETDITTVTIQQNT
jgi:hypothetical protein